MRPAVPFALALLALLAPLAAPAGLVAPAEAATGSIRPGAIATTPAGQCTLNFVFDGAGGTVYLGIAAHCGSIGNSVSGGGWTGFGTIVYDDDASSDFALIEVKPAFLAYVNPEVKGHPGMPTGVTTWTETAIGDAILLSGYGIVFATTAATQERRAGVLQSDSAFGYCAQTTAIFGDSGGPVLHMKTGKALGVVSHLGIECAAELAGPTIERGIARATAAGFPVTLRTAV